MDSKDKQQEMFKKGKELIKSKSIIKTKTKPVNPYDTVNTTPCHNFSPFMKEIS